MHFKALKSALIEDFKKPKRHISDALVDALVQRIIEEKLRAFIIMVLGLILVTNKNHLGF